jgi:hypothetical protein
VKGAVVLNVSTVSIFTVKDPILHMKLSGVSETSISFTCLYGDKFQITENCITVALHSTHLDGAESSKFQSSVFQEIKKVEDLKFSRR